jgi:hypothetical protein
MGKYNKLYDVLKCPIDIPINDMDVWNMYPEYRWLYNKMNLCEYQKIKHAPMPIEPKEYPIILKPITNLYGMGLNIKLLNNEKEFYDNWYSNNFWMEYFTGNHYSYDIIILNGIIQFSVCFQGIKDDNLIGKFKYWIYIKRELSPIIYKLINDKFTTYSGVLNVEVIDDNIIECHLRMGDIDIFPTIKLLEGIIATYQGLSFDWNIELPQTYFCPFWVYENTSEEVQEFCTQEIYPLLENNNYIYDFDIDNLTMASPGKYKRLLWISCGDLNYAKLLFESIRNIIKEKYKIEIPIIDF